MLRFVLIIFDCNVDLIFMFFYFWIYQSLCFDVFRFELNCIMIEIFVDFNNFVKGIIKKSYDLVVNDFFWVKNVCFLFFQVVEDIDVEFIKYKEEVEVIIKKIGVMDFEDL